MPVNRPIVFLIISAISLVTATAALAQACKPTPERHAERIHGEIGSQSTFIKTVDEKWFFRLEPAPYGWDIRLRDADKMDLTQITPPFRLAPNPREVYGWHFRNAANTGRNTGDVNAPQHVRFFQFSSALSGTGGFRPPSGAPVSTTADPNQGRGVFTIRDMGLADLEPGQKARMNFVKFDVCLTWPKTGEESRALLNARSPVFSNEDREIMFGCGLDHKKFELSAWVLPRMIGGDLDADGALDHAAPVIRKSDGRRGIAICRSGTWISLVGYNAGAKTPLKSGYFTLRQYLDKVEFWEMRSVEGGTGKLVLGQTEKSEVALRWNGKYFTNLLLGHFVEP